MKRLMTTFFLTLTLLTITVGTRAMEISEYKQSKDNKKTWPVTLIYLNGVGVGASMTASVLVQQGRPPIFCQPKEINLRKQDYIRLIDSFIAKNDVTEVPVESVLLMALMVAFPCV